MRLKPLTVFGIALSTFFSLTIITMLMKVFLDLEEIKSKGN